jgi:SAM-dependent methyltransferase
MVEEEAQDSEGTTGLAERYAGLGSLRAVLDPNDKAGWKNQLIDAMQWSALAPYADGGCRLLDVGCGTGRFAKRLAALGVDYTGVDASQAMVAKARQTNPDLAERFSVADACHLPFTDGEFDTCLTCYVLQHLMHAERAAAFAAEIHRVLGAGGKLLAIEQVSYSGRSSGTVPYPSCEADYVTTLGAGFRVVGMTRIRCSFFGRPTRWLLNNAQRAPRVSSRLMEHAARREIRRATNAPASLRSKAEYFDLLIVAEAR